MTLLKHGSGNPHSLTTALLRHRRQGAPGAGFDIATMVFTPAMSKRPGPAGVFDAAPIVQGTGGVVVGDRLSYVRGNKLGNAVDASLYDRMDKNQGTIVFWVTPEFAPADMIGARFFSDFYMEITVATATILQFAYYDTGWRSVNVNIAAWTAGTTYLICARYNAKNTLDGTNHLCLSVNNAHTFGGTQLAPGNAGSPAAIGGNTSYIRSANAIIEGFTLYRRVLYDGAYGVPPVDQTDELAAIYAAGAGLDPAQVTGSWDATLCLPTNSAPGALVSGEGEAWSHPHSSNLLDVAFMSDGGPPGTPFAVEFNGSSTYVDCGSGATLDDIPAGGGEITVGMWFRMDRTSGEATLFQKGVIGSGCLLFIDSSGALQLTIYLATTSVGASHSGNVRDGKWHYAGFHYNDTTKAGRIHLDGRWGTASVGVGAYQSDAASSLFVGRRVSAGTWYLQGGTAWWEVWDNDHHVAGTDFIPPRAPTAAGPGNLIDTWWADEGAGVTVAARVTTPANDGTITDPDTPPWTAVWQQDGTPVIPQSTEYTGGASGAVITDAVSIQNLTDNAVAYEMWFRLDDATTYQIFLRKGTPTTSCLIQYEGSIDQLSAYIYAANTNSITAINSFRANYGSFVWHHLAVTFDDAGDRKARMYLDGILRGTGAAAVGLVIADAGSDLGIWGSESASSGVVGALGWVRLSDVVRYTATFDPAGRSNPPAVDGNTVVQLDMNDGAGATALDTSGNANHAALTAYTWLSTCDMEIESPGEQGPYALGYDMGSDGIDGITIIENQEVTAGVSYVIRATLSIGMSGQAWPAVYAYDNIGAVNLLTHRFPRMTGPHTGANNAASLTDAGARWIYNFAGWTVYNITDGSSATITSNSEYNIVGGLAGGTDNDWDTNDVYLLRPPGNRSYSQHPWQETAVFTAPAGCTSINVRVLNLASKGITHIHQVECYASLAVNGDHESLNGGFPGAAELITGWTNINLDAGDTEPEAAIIHAGAQSLEWNVGAASEGMYLDTAALCTVGRFYAMGMWQYGDGSRNVGIGTASLARMVLHADAAAGSLWGIGTARWLEVMGVWRCKNAQARPQLDAQSAPVGDRWSDDVYMVELDDVALTVTPASEANSLEPAPDYIRVDGDDQCALPANGLDRAGGLVFRTVVRQDITTAPTFRGEPGSLLDLQLDAGNYLYLRIMNAAAQIHLDYQAAAGGAQNSIWAPGVLWEPGDALLLRVEYGAFGVRLWADGLLVINNVNPCFFDAAPTTRLIGGGVGATSGAPDIVIGEP